MKDKFEVFKDLTKIYFGFLKYCEDHELKCFIFLDLVDKKILKEMREYFASDCLKQDIVDANKIIMHLENESLEDWLKFIISYNRYLSHIKYCYLYNTDNIDGQVYINDDGTGLLLKNTSDNRDFSIEYRFEDSEIIQIGFNSSTDPLTNFIENGVSGNPNNTVTFADVNIINNSENVKNFKFIIGENYKFESEEDQILFNYIKKYTSNCIYKSFVDIIEDIGSHTYNVIDMDFYIFIYKIIIPSIGGKKHWII